jgi:hypothetical protein
MLQELIKNLQSNLKNYSQGLAKQNMLVDIPWTMVDGDLNLQRLIFRKDNSLYIVREGEIQESKWEYLNAMNSLVINLGDRRVLMNEVFVDGKALILKKDGTAIEFLAFANQNELPDLNLIGYLTSIEKKGIEAANTFDPYIYPGSKPIGCASLFIIFLISISILLSL